MEEGVYQILLSESAFTDEQDMPTLRFWRLFAMRSPGPFEVRN